MNRRAFVTGLGAVLAAPLAIEAAGGKGIARRLGRDRPGVAVDLGVSRCLREGMRERGWIESRNLAIEARWGARDQAGDLVAELNSLTVDVIVAVGPMVRGAKAAAGTTAVVFSFSGDPVDAKLVASVARSGTLTGITFLAYELVHKRLELLRKALPGLTRVATFANVMHPGEQRELRESQGAAGRLGLTRNTSRSDHPPTCRPHLTRSPATARRPSLRSLISSS
jgi:putative tryptophan/tyrosine transport system substrate-binding protein